MDISQCPAHVDFGAINIARENQFHAITTPMMKDLFASMHFPYILPWLIT